MRAYAFAFVLAGCGAELSGASPPTPDAFQVQPDAPKASPDAAACLDTTTLQNCGRCGNACAAGDFCDGTTCQAPTFPSFCANKKVYVIYDEITPDDNAADLM